MEHTQKQMTLQCKISNGFKIFYAEILKSMNITMKRILKVMSWQKCTAQQKTHKFGSTDIKLTKLKFHPIIDQTGTYTYKTSKVISRYLKLLCDSEYTIKDKQSFAKLIKELPLLQEDKGNASYDIECCFTNIPMFNTIDYILEQIYVQHKLKPICSELIFKRLLIKLSTEVTFTFNSKFCIQTDGCALGGPLSVTFSDMYMTKMERDVIRPFNPIFYHRYVDDI